MPVAPFGLHSMREVRWTLGGGVGTAQMPLSRAREESEWPTAIARAREDPHPFGSWATQPRGAQSQVAVESQVAAESVLPARHAVWEAEGVLVAALPVQALQVAAVQRSEPA